jgi:hypothetical protein
MRIVVAGAGVAAGGVPVRACLNDTRTESAETEFRSRYERQEPTKHAGSPMLMGFNVMGLGAAAVGGALVATGVWQQVRRGRRA